MHKMCRVESFKRNDLTQLLVRILKLMFKWAARAILYLDSLANACSGKESGHKTPYC